MTEIFPVVSSWDVPTLKREQAIRESMCCKTNSSGAGFKIYWPFFRAGIMVFQHEVSPKECGPSLPLLHWNQPDNLPIARTICYHIKRDFFLAQPHVPELKNHCFWYREQSLFQECGRDGVFIKARTEALAWKVSQHRTTLPKAGISILHTHIISVYYCFACIYLLFEPFVHGIYPC